ncbi:hypothetical protein [Streptomyces sp. NPDC059398]|uniref:hypothetical protein n=1 Tax=Streptomyces sp. NPDC059398 TaxID=3346820 RepID=UPI0036773507
MAGRLVEALFTALDGQTFVVPGTDAAGAIVPQLAKNLTALPDQRRELAAAIKELLEPRPPSVPLTSMPATDVRTEPRILIDVRDGSAFPTAA